MSKPLIGLTPSHNTETNVLQLMPAYLHSIIAANGIPVLLPLEVSQQDLQQLVETVDGILFTGGPDIHAFHFGEETHRNTGNVSPERDSMELNLLNLAMASKKPILGICRGIQLFNVGLGGTIYQDIPSQFQEEFPISHSQPFRYTIPSHRIQVVPGSKLHQITQQTTLQVNSMHHQAICKPAPGLDVCGYAPNGLIEAVEKKDYPFFLGVQWHPEFLTPSDQPSALLFQEFIHACQI